MNSEVPWKIAQIVGRIYSNPFANANADIESYELYEFNKTLLNAGQT